MSTVSGTESLGFLQSLGLNTTQGKSAEEGADLFAAMLQGMPVENDAGAAAGEEASKAAALPTADANAAVTSISPGEEPLELVDDTMLPQAALTVGVEDGETESADLPTTHAAQGAVQLFEGQLALQRRFAAPAKAASPDSADDDAKPAPDVSLHSDDRELATGSTPPASLKPDAVEPRNSTPAKAKKSPGADATADVTESDAPAPAASEKNSRVEQLTPADSTSAGDSAESRNAQAPVAGTAMPQANSYTAGENATAVYGSGRDRSAATPIPGYAHAFANTGKDLPQSGKFLPVRKDDVGKAQSKDQGGMLLAGFTEVSGLEDTGFSFDQIANALHAQDDAAQAQSTAVPSNTGSLTIDTRLVESRAESNAAELLPDSATTTLEAESTMGSHAWVEDTATQLSWLKEQGVEKAHIKLHPEDLGSLDISITVSDGQAYVQFVTSTPEARELLQNSLPSLREMLQNSGLALAEGNVAQGDARKGRDFEHNPQQHDRFMNTPEAPPQNMGWMRPAAHGRSQIDYYI